MFEMKSVEDARRAYAERLRQLGPLNSDRVVTAFATVPRERFLGAGPWTIIPPGRTARRTPDSDPCHLYDNVLVALDEDRNINNGEPRLWAVLFDQLQIGPGASVAHVGSGTGYYSAILAELVGSSGKVTAIEVDPDFALQTWENLAPWPQAKTVAGNGLTDVPADVDFIVVSAGLTFVPVVWLDALREGYEVFPVVDAVGGTSPEAHRAGLERIVQAGAVPMTSVQFLCELQRDWARGETYDGAMEIFKAHTSYGIGVRYAKQILGGHAS